MWRLVVQVIDRKGVFCCNRGFPGFGCSLGATLVQTPADVLKHLAELQVCHQAALTFSSKRSAASRDGAVFTFSSDRPFRPQPLTGLP
jgi:ribosome-binding protein aMBF1 (putative translation factor)